METMVSSCSVTGSHAQNTVNRLELRERRGREERQGKKLDAGTQGRAVCGRLVNSRGDGGMELSAEK